jgi:2-polyprenyl-3-methyl-5-hydroxy-6-metoxy-1,4-benzoquinol methylase
VSGIRDDAAPVFSFEVPFVTCCARYSAAESKFDAKVAETDLRRYQRSGPDASTRILLAELRCWPLRKLHLLDVGCGIGVISLELVGAGLAGVTLADASPAYLEVARRQVGPRYAPLPAQFILGDFTVTSGTLPDADVVTLDRVVRCYPDAEALLHGAATRARRLVAFTYHPDRWYLRAMIALENFLYRLRGSSFRAFVHPPQRMAAVLENAGFVRAARHGSLVWALDLYHRPDAA